MPVPNNLDTKSQSKTPSNPEEGGCATEKNIVESNPALVTVSQPEVKYKETPYRWYVMVAYCLTVLQMVSNGLLFQQ